MDIAQVDEIIERLLDVRNGRPGKQVQLAENEIRLLCLTAKEIFMSQPNLLELEAPIKICGGCRQDSSQRPGSPPSRCLALLGQAWGLSGPRERPGRCA
jgi:hypothetical protein